MEERLHDGWKEKTMNQRNQTTGTQTKSAGTMKKSKDKIF